MEIGEVIQVISELCGIGSFIVALIALFKVSDIQKQIRKQISSKDKWTQNAKATGGSHINQRQTGDKRQ